MSGSNADMDGVFCSSSLSRSGLICAAGPPAPEDAGSEPAKPPEMAPTPVAMGLPPEVMKDVAADSTAWRMLNFMVRDHHAAAALG